jgi:hypothetical protein
MNRLLDHIRALFGSSQRPGSAPLSETTLTAVEYEAVALIAYEGRAAYDRACEQAEYCRASGSEDGYMFWSHVAAEVALRTKGRLPEQS